MDKSGSKYVTQQYGEGLRVRVREDDEDASVEESRNREAGHEQVHGGMAPQAQSRASNAPLSPQTGLLGAGLDLNVMSWMDTINQVRVSR